MHQHWFLSVTFFPKRRLRGEKLAPIWRMTANVLSNFYLTSTKLSFSFPFRSISAFIPMPFHNIKKVKVKPFRLINVLFSFYVSISFIEGQKHTKQPLKGSDDCRKQINIKNVFLREWRRIASSFCVFLVLSICSKRQEIRTEILFYVDSYWKSLGKWKWKKVETKEKKDKKNENRDATQTFI